MSGRQGGKLKPTRQPKSEKSESTKKEVDHPKVFADKVRDHKELESRWAVLQDTRVEYFRGKDFIALLNKHPELKDVLRGGEYGAIDSDEDVALLLLKRKLILRCDRVIKTLRAGKKKLSKWPARLEVFHDQTFSVDDAFFAWTFEKRRPLWQTVLSFLVPILTLACCLFPVFPHWCKLVVLYTCLACLTLIFSALFLRWVIFGLLWIILGKSVWFLPNILAEEASLSDAFRFWPEPSKEDEKPPKWTARLAFTLLTGGIIWFCFQHAPDEAARARYQKRVSNIIDEVLVWSPRLAISGDKEAPPVVLNETLKNETLKNETDEAGKDPVSSEKLKTPEENLEAKAKPNDGSNADLHENIENPQDISKD